eukprot:TRINITY_DN81328_c0_g1_i1.p1 TRINITY_DN81328_c0_g1~~TRINITY_DN81328_c0_g1_i1.p1  ORF type:complete len:305 (+),score=29.38 TRINITY_DN81328_c0_g1_i1:102-917(+)
MPAVGKLRFAFCGKPVKHTPLYNEAPTCNTASTNAGDWNLYVGGGAINKAFQQILGIKSKNNGYQELHRHMLKKAWASPGTLCVTTAGDAELSRKPGVLVCCSRISGASGASGDAVGVAYVDIFASECRPLNDKNIGMLYVVGPKGKGAPGGHGPTIEGRDAFLSAVQDMAENAVAAVLEYNSLASATPDSGFPPLEELQFCLVSGGVYRHPETTKRDVARATVLGMLAGAEQHKAQAEQLQPVTIRFAYDEGVFEEAVAELVPAAPRAAI